MGVSLPVHTCPRECAPPFCSELIPSHAVQLVYCTRLCYTAKSSAARNSGSIRELLTSAQLVFPFRQRVQPVL
jgi:hypothetical protein